MKYVCKRLAAMVMVLICLAAMLAIPASAKTDLPTVISQAKEGVVKLFVVGFSPDDTPAAAAVGSGFAVGQKGSTPEYFVTNWHVASAYLSEYNYAFDSDHVRIWIMLDNFALSDVTGLPSEATSVECSIVRIAESGYPDYAILRAARPVTECKPLPIRSSESVKQGETVVALGCPAVVDDLSANVGGNDITATRGTVARHMVMSAAGNTKVLLHDAVISGGNSGGPLIDENGNVIGLNTYGIVDSYSCAIYSDYVMQVLDQMGIPYMTAGSSISVVTIAAAAVAVAAVAVAIYFLLRNRKSTEKSSKEVNPGVGPVSTVPADGYKPSFRVQLPDGRIIPVPAGKVAVGRDPSCQIRLPESAAAVSRRHCTLESNGEFLILVDEGSRNGTFIHGKRVPAGTKVALKHGSSFCVGTSENRITVC